MELPYGVTFHPLWQTEDFIELFYGFDEILDCVYIYFSGFYDNKANKGGLGVKEMHKLNGINFSKVV